MPLMQRVVKPKTRRSKRFLEKREPKIEEDTKTAILLRGSTASQTGLTALKDFQSLKKPHAVLYNKYLMKKKPTGKSEAKTKFDWRPFEDINPLEAFAQKKDASLFMFASHNKKRPHNLVLGRLYDGHLLDMAELGLEGFKSLSEFKVPKIPVGTKPILLFAGEAFDTDPEFQRLKNMFIDFFRGPELDQIRLTGLEHVLMFTAHEGKIYLRSYKTVFKKSGGPIPRVELVEMGPRSNFVLRRTKLASQDLFKLATKKPAQLKPKKVKNIKRDNLGTTLGRIHMKRLDYSKLQTRKMKGLRKTAEEKKEARKAKKQKTQESSASEMTEEKL